MPPLPPVPQVVRVLMKSTYDEDIDVLNRFFVEYTGTAPTAADLVTYATHVMGEWASEFKPLYGPNVSLVTCTVQDLTSETSASGEFSETETGTRTGGTLPAGTAALAKFLIARRYRGGKPRVYLPFFTVTDLDNAQTWLSTSTDSLLTALEAFVAGGLLTTVSGTVFATHVNVSYFKGFTNFTEPSGRVRAIPTLRPVPLVDAVAGYAINPNVASQRRRNETP